MLFSKKNLLSSDRNVSLIYNKQKGGQSHSSRQHDIGSKL